MDMDTRTRLSGRPKALRSAAVGLGLFSIGLGAVELLAPRALARATGLKGQESLLRAYGLREIASGLGLLASDDPRNWLWARLAGDALDVSTLATRAFGGASGEASNARKALLLTAPIGALDLLFALMAQSRDDARKRAVYDYSDRVGLGGTPDALRGAARDAPIPRDMRQPEALRPYAET